jgi:hypothetical protein
MYFHNHKIEKKNDKKNPMVPRHHKALDYLVNMVLNLLNSI